MHECKTMLAVICYVGCSLQHTYVRMCVCTYLSKCLLVHHRATTVQHLVVRGGAGVPCTTPLSDCCVIVHSPQMCCGHMHVISSNHSHPVSASRTAFLLAKFRPRCPIISITRDARTARIVSAHLPSSLECLVNVCVLPPSSLSILLPPPPSPAVPHVPRAAPPAV